MNSPFLYLVISVASGCLGIAFYAFQASNIGQFFSMFSVAFLIASASIVGGGLLGFLFGIPRTLQLGGLQSNEDTNSSKDKVSGLAYQVNTNLEQISDWLTKILVGVGLTQIPALLKALRSYSEFASVAFGGLPSSKVFAVAILIYFLICGFIISYLLTRLYLAGAFRLADLAAVGAKLEQVQSKVDELERQAEIDAKALSITQHQLNPEAGVSPIEQDKINAAIIPASSSVKAQIFYLAQRVRQENWKEQQTKPKMERTIPIFRSLIASDLEGLYHTNHGQLGFALKDQRQPNWKEANSELTKAIELRGSWQTEGWVLYEFNRAYCKIKLDEAFSQQKVSDEEIKKDILAELKIAAKSSMVNNIIKNDPTITKWLSLNGITWAN